MVVKKEIKRDVFADLQHLDGKHPVPDNQEALNQSFEKAMLSRGRVTPNGTKQKSFTILEDDTISAETDLEQPEEREKKTRMKTKTKQAFEQQQEQEQRLKKEKSVRGRLKKSMSKVALAIHNHVDNHDIVKMKNYGDNSNGNHDSDIGSDGNSRNTAIDNTHNTHGNNKQKQKHQKEHPLFSANDLEEGGNNYVNYCDHKINFDENDDDDDNDWNDGNDDDDDDDDDMMMIATLATTTRK